MYRKGITNPKIAAAGVGESTVRCLGAGRNLGLIATLEVLWTLGGVKRVGWGTSTSGTPLQRSFHRLDLGFDKGDLVGVEPVLGVQLLVDLRDRLRPVDIRHRREVLQRDVLPLDC